MKVLSDNTARRILERLDASGRGMARGRGPSPATPVSPLWQIHVRDGGVTVDAGLWVDAEGLHESPGADLGPASAGLVVAELADGELALSLRAADSMPEGPFRVVGEISAGAGGALVVGQYETGPLVFEPPPEHWGGTSPLARIDAGKAGSWNAAADEGGGEGEGGAAAPSAVAWSALSDIELDGEGGVSAKWYRTVTVDTMGNVVAVSEPSRSAAADPDGGGGGEEGGEDGGGGGAPPCGNPLNKDGGGAVENPLDQMAGKPVEDETHGGSEPGFEENPLDSPGEGGYTPECGKQQEGTN